MQARNWKPAILVALATLLLLGGIFAPPASAQFLGYTSPQTATATLFATPTTCTGSAQTSVVPNIGQTVHQITFFNNTGISQAAVKLQGSNDGVNYFDISDTLQPGNTTFQTLTVSGAYYPVVRASVSCNAAGTFGLTYAGTSVPVGTLGGTPLVSQIDKALAVFGLANTSTAYANFVPPFGSSAGTLQFVYGGVNGPSGSTLSVACLNISGQTAFLPLSPVTLNTGVNFVQSFNVSPGVCAFLAVTYTTGGASASQYRLEYLFTPPGTPNSADPCAVGPKQSAFANITTATTTALVPVSSLTSVYVCGFSLDMVATVAADTLLFEQGAGATCVTSPTAISPTYSSGILTTGAVPIAYGNGGAAIMKTAPGNGLCAVSTVGTGPSIAVLVSYVQQ